MKFEYTITKEGGEAEIMKAMSWKKLFKSLLMKYPQFSGWCTYMNKKGHVQVRSFNKGREIKKSMTYTECEVCGCTPKPDEWSHISGICFDCT